jgi:hypothetical protein
MARRDYSHKRPVPRYGGLSRAEYLDILYDLQANSSVYRRQLYRAQAVHGHAAGRIDSRFNRLVVAAYVEDFSPEYDSYLWWLQEELDYVDARDDNYVAAY